MATKLVIIYYSGWGHTAKVAEAINQGAVESQAQSTLIKVSDKSLSANEWEALDQADAIIFGAPTYMGSLAGPFKMFMDSTSAKWAEKKWMNKIVGGFTNSASYSGDKLCSIQQLFHFAMQHCMIWVGQAEMSPQFGDNDMPNYDILNRLGSWSGLMTQSNSKSPSNIRPPEGDLATARLFGKRVVEIANKFKI